MHESQLWPEEYPSESGYQSTPAEKWDMDETKHSLDELFRVSSQYRNSTNYMELLDFIKKFPYIAPFNAMLAHVQMPGARYVLPPRKWYRYYGRTIKPGARPIVILRTMGPVDFVFDVADTEGNELPPELENPFTVYSGEIGNALPTTLLNCIRDGIRVYKKNLGSEAAGAIRRLAPKSAARNYVLMFKEKQIPVEFELELAENRSPEEQYVTLAHELGHLYCGHLGTINPLWWPDRLGLNEVSEEFEAESVAYLVCKRIGIETTSEKYLADFVGAHGEVPPISLECVMKAAGLIERMGKKMLNLRKIK